MQPNLATRQFSNILVPLDGSELADAVLDTVIPLALRDDVPVHALWVTSGPDAQREGLSREAEEALSRRHLEAVAARLSAAGVRPQLHVLDGDPVTEIVKAAQGLEGCLIAMSSHGRSGVVRWVRGSVAETVLREATTPILLISRHSAERAISGQFSRVLVPMAGSERSAAVLPYVIDLVRGTDAEVVLLRSEWAGMQRPLLAMKLSLERVAETLRPWQERLERAGLRVRVLATHGSAAHEILDAAEREQVDLVALSTHGRAGLTRFVEGSVTEKVLRHCRYPLLVVRAPEPV